MDVKEYLKQIRLSAYRAILPRQQNLVESLQKLIDSNQPKGEPLPPNIKASIEALIKQLPPPEKVSNTPQLRQALADTGLFTEAKLLTGLVSRSDLKVNLNQLISLIRPMLAELQGGIGKSKGGVKPGASPAHSGISAAQLNLLGELFRNSDSAIARIQAQQLASLPQDESTQQIWHHELPIYHNDKLESLSILIERERCADGDNESTPWGITLQMNLSPLGPMRAQLKLTGCMISTTFWAEEKRTLTLVNQNLPTLKSAFERAGLEVSDLRVLHGRITPQEERLPEDLSLVNVKV